jgi:DNA-binding SARP family transcriptional activator
MASAEQPVSRGLSAVDRAVRVQAFGQFSVSSSRCIIDHWHSKPAKLLFAFLLIKGVSTVNKEELMEILWPGRPPASSAGNLKTVVHQLRETLRPLFDSVETDPIVFKEGRYVINPAIEFNIDFLEFDRHWKQGKKFEREGKRAEAKAEYELAEALYKGDLLAEEPYQDWTIPYRESF